jgi:hypothetical protein
MLNTKVAPSSVKWCNEEETFNQEHQALQGKTVNDLEDERKTESTSGVLNSQKVPDIYHMSGCVNVLDAVNKKSPKRPRRQPITRNCHF